MATRLVDQNTATSLAAGDIFKLVQPGGGRSDAIALHVELNSAATLTATIKAAGIGSGWTPLACLGYPQSTTTPTSSVTATDVYMIDGTGRDVFLDVTAFGAGGTPRIWFGYGEG